MSQCRELERCLTPYVDGVAAAADCRRVETHLAACPACRTRVACERQIREAVTARRSGLRPCAPAGLRQRCGACRTPATVVAAPAFTRRNWMPLSMAATFVLAVAGLFLYGAHGGVEALAAQLVVDHVKCFEFSPEPEATPSAIVLGKNWQEQRGWPIQVAASEPREQLELIGVRRCVSTEGFTAHVMYKWRGQPLSVYVMNSVPARLHGLRHVVETLGSDTVIWAAGGRTYAVVADAKPGELEPIARYVSRTVQ